MTYREADETADTQRPATKPTMWLVRQTVDHLNAKRIVAQHRNEAFVAANLQTVPRFLSLHEVDILELNEDGTIKVRE